jgi:predicted nucleotide-binding protein
MIEKLGLEVIILHEQADGGKTIIEKFEANAQEAAFAVVLLTPDDVGASAAVKPPQLNPRARQNVIFELGYFVGKLGRDRVRALYKGNVELPSDYLGVLWIPMDDGGAWRLKLAQEMQSSGLDVDLNKLVR